MNSNTASSHKTQAQFSKKQEDDRVVWRHVQPWQFQEEGQGRKSRLVCWRLCRLAKIIASYASKSGSCWASLKTLASKLGLSPAQTARYLARLEEQGVVVSKGPNHKHGTTVRTMDPSALASAPTKGESRPSVNSFGLKKGMCYRPAYAPLRESETSTTRESERSNCANLRDKSFLRKSSGEGQTRKLAVGKEVPRTCTTVTVNKVSPLKERIKPLQIVKTPIFLPKDPLPSTFEKNLENFIKRNHFMSVREYHEYNSFVWGTRDRWVSEVRNDRLNWDETCKAIGYAPDYDDPLLCLEFLDVVKEIIEEHCEDAEITQAKLCMKILDKCGSTRPKIPFPSSFMEHKRNLAKAEKQRSKKSSLSDLELFQLLD